MSEQQAITDNFNDRLDILRHVSEIKLRLKKDITNDFVLAKLNEKDKEAIVEMTGNAYFSKRLLDILAEKSFRWTWNEKTKKYDKMVIDKKEKKAIEKISKSMFDSYMVKIYMTVILNRNVDKNYLINVLSGYVDKEDGGVNLNDQEGMKEAIGELLADQSKGEK